MKKKIIILAVCCAAFMFAGCAKSPSSITRQCITAVQSGNIEKIKQFATVETAALLPDSLDSWQAMFGAFTVTIFKEQITGDEAVVTVQLPSGSNADIQLVKVNDEWKVSLN